MIGQITGGVTTGTVSDNRELTAARRAMVDDLRRKGVTDERVLAAMLTVPRDHYVPMASGGAAYADSALAIGEGQTISQPYMVAAMTEALELTGHERLLEIGTGSGYQAAVLATLVARVFSVERIPALADKARMQLESDGYRNVRVTVGDGTLGCPAEAPFDAVMVTAGAPDVPPPLLDQLAEGGRLVIPSGDLRVQTLSRYRKRDGVIHREALFDCVFVPLIGRHGWQRD